MENIKKVVTAAAQYALNENHRLQQQLSDAVLLTDYPSDGDDWSNAFQQALNEHEIVRIPAKGQPYWISTSVVIPSNRRIEAEDGAVIRLRADCNLLLMRNEHTADGTHHPIDTSVRAKNIAIIGGHWEENRSMRLGYGRSGKYDTERSFYGVSTCLLFNNIDHLTLKNMTMGTCGSFAVQIGDATNIVIENIHFDHCMADGIHMNGNVENVYVHHLDGQVGDDLLALNMYDWQDSSINFGPGRNILCEDLFNSPDSECFSMRLLTGMYRYDDGSTVDCSLENVWARRLHGLHGFKMYCQTPRYEKGSDHEFAATGSADNLIFEDITLDVTLPLDPTGEARNAHPKAGHYGAFEINENIRTMYLDDVRFALHTETYSLGHAFSVGPKSCRVGDVEWFDPYLSSCVNTIYHRNITVNGEAVDDLRPHIHEVKFDPLYDDMPSTGSGTVINVLPLT